MLGMVNFASGIPMIALSLVGGTLADRYSKRNILLLTQVAQIICAVTLGVLGGDRSHPHLATSFAIAFVLGISAAFEMPSVAALVPELVGKEHIAAAIGRRPRGIPRHPLDRVPRSRVCDGIVGISVSLLRECPLVCRAHRRASHDPSAPGRRSRTGRRSDAAASRKVLPM